MSRQCVRVEEPRHLTRPECLGQPDTSFKRAGSGKNEEMVAGEMILSRPGIFFEFLEKFIRTVCLLAVRAI